MERVAVVFHPLLRSRRAPAPTGGGRRCSARGNGGSGPRRPSGTSRPVTGARRAGAGEGQHQTEQQDRETRRRPRAARSAAAPVCGSAPATARSGTLRNGRDRVRTVAGRTVTRPVTVARARARAVGGVLAGVAGRVVVRGVVTFVGVLLARVGLGVPLGVVVAEHGDLVLRRVDRGHDARCRLVARAGAVLAVGGVTAGAVRARLVVSRLRRVAVADDGHLVVAGVDRGGGGGVGLVARSVAVLAVVVLPAVAPVVSPSVVVLSAVLPSPMTVTWFSPASTGAVAPASVWLPEPLPSSPDVVFPAPSDVPVPPLPSVVLSRGVAVADHGDLVAGRVDRGDRDRGRSGCPRAGAVGPRGGVPPASPESVPETGCPSSLPTGGVAVADDGHLVARGVHRCGRARIRLVARAGAVLAAGGVTSARAGSGVPRVRPRGRRRCRPAGRRPRCRRR